jgi:hypothetical protein
MVTISKEFLVAFDDDDPREAISKMHRMTYTCCDNGWIVTAQIVSKRILER